MGVGVEGEDGSKLAQRTTQQHISASWAAGETVFGTQVHLETIAVGSWGWGGVEGRGTW